MDKSIIKKQLDIQQASRKMDPHLSSEELENLKKLLDSKTEAEDYGQWKGV